MDNCSSINGSMVTGTSQQLHAGRVYSHPSGDRNYRDYSTGYPGAACSETPIANWVFD